MQYKIFRLLITHFVTLSCVNRYIIIFVITCTFYIIMSNHRKYFDFLMFEYWNLILSAFCINLHKKVTCVKTINTNGYIFYWVELVS